MKKLILLSISLAFFLIGMSQNLVVNGNFEELDKKPKDLGMIDKATGWYSATNAPADLYIKAGKSGVNDIPENKYGKEDAKTEDGYAGLVFYSYGEREPRTYISTKLSEPLKKGEWYCIRFHVSLSDLSKYAVNNIGLYVSTDSVYQEGNGNLSFDPQIIHSQNRVFNQMWSWESICRIYVAKGGEQYITIGNFGKQLETAEEKMRRPKEYSVAQERVAYYYVDDVSVTEDGTKLNCKCEAGNFAFAHLDKEEKNFGSDEDDMPAPQFIDSKGRSTGGTDSAAIESATVSDNIIVPFDLAKSNLNTGAKEKLDETIKYLKENPTVKIKVIGHIDQTESRVPDLSKNRMVSVQKYLIINGISADNISVDDVGENQPLDDSGDKDKRSKNTVVEIEYL